MIDRVRLVLADHDRGSEPIALAILAPVMVGLLGLLVLGGRIAIASSSISGVASNAARDASIARTPAQAVRIAQGTATASLLAQNLHCQGTPEVVVDTSGYGSPPGVPASIRVDVTCVVSLSDLGMPGLPGTRVLRDHATSPLDPYRSISVGFGISEAPEAGNRSVGVGYAAR
jgi:Flp pilus assembly protein TadG